MWGWNKPLTDKEKATEDFGKRLEEGYYDGRWGLNDEPGFTPVIELLTPEELAEHDSLLTQEERNAYLKNKGIEMDKANEERSHKAVMEFPEKFPDLFEFIKEL
ncbi:MAG: hypothetical protein LBN07_04750 [Christensenellaceae bacterium]|nr:hypothetical protein [Christensenellaceae bacterium]